MSSITEIKNQKPHPGIQDCLDDLARGNKVGDIRGIAVAVLLADGTTEQHTGGRYRYFHMLGALTLLQAWMVERHEEPLE